MYNVMFIIFFTGFNKLYFEKKKHTSFLRFRFVCMYSTQIRNKEIMRNYLNFLNMYVWKYVDATAAVVALLSSCIITAHAKFFSIISFCMCRLFFFFLFWWSYTAFKISYVHRANVIFQTEFTLKHNYRIECQSGIAFGAGALFFVVWLLFFWQ